MCTESLLSPAGRMGGRGGSGPHGHPYWGEEEEAKDFKSDQVLCKVGSRFFAVGEELCCGLRT